MKTNRLEYIDILRSIAIIMMLEGHFMTLSLETAFRNDENPIYHIWKFSRGLTAPLFLSISGLIFTYLLLKNKMQGWNNLRVQKGLKRVGVLILLGYLLQFNLNNYFFDNQPLFTSLTQIFHVLQCIGASLLLLIIVYLIRIYILKIPLGFLLLFLGVFTITISPTLYNLDYSNVPRFIENILIVSHNTQLNTSVFPLFPWAAYVFLGGALGCLIFKLKNTANHPLFPIALILLGLGYEQISYFVLENIQKLPFFKELTPFESRYEPIRFCHVLIFIGTVILIQKIILFLKTKTTFNISNNKVNVFLGCSFALGYFLFTQTLQSLTQQVLTYILFFTPIVIGLYRLFHWKYQTFLNIGQSTLSVYVFHVIILYNGFFGFKFGAYFKEQLSPFFAITGAILFVFFFLAFIEYQALLVQKINRLLLYFKIMKRNLLYKTNSTQNTSI